MDTEIILLELDPDFASYTAVVASSVLYPMQSMAWWKFYFHFLKFHQKLFS